jgi:hypothetical protein
MRLLGWRDSRKRAEFLWRTEAGVRLPRSMVTLALMAAAIIGLGRLACVRIVIPVRIITAHGQSRADTDQTPMAFGSIPGARSVPDAPSTM